MPISYVKQKWKEIVREITEPNPSYGSLGHSQGFKSYSYDTVDVLRHGEGSEWRGRSMKDSKKVYVWFRRLQEKFPFVNLFFNVISSEWTFLAILGFVSASLFLTTELIVENIGNGRDLLMSSLPNISLVRCLFWTLYSLLFAILARLCVEYISPFSAGSGIPEMKSILGGVRIGGYLTFKNLIAKVIGNVAAYGSDISIGREGPFIMVCGILANVLTKLPMFRKIRKDKSRKFQVLSAACAAGIATVFGAPVGGVLFSIEVTSTYYLVQNLAKCFLCAFAASFFVNYIEGRGLVALFQTSFQTKMFSDFEIASFIILGASCGIIGAFFVVVQAKMNTWRKAYKFFAQDTYKQIVFISIVSSICTYASFMPLKDGQFSIINRMFSEEPLESNWLWPSMYLNLCYFIIVKFILTVISIGLPIPCGLFVPVFVLGSVIGRLWGEVMASLFPDLGVIPGGYAVVGAAAFSAGCTRALSASVIIFELTGQLGLMFPVLIAVILATAIGNLLSPSVYDKILEGKGLPYLPPLSTAGHRKTARDVMSSDMNVLTKLVTYKEISLLLANTNFHYFPLVDSISSMILLGEVRRDFLEEVLHKREREHQKLKRDSSSESVPNSPSLGGLEDWLDVQVPLELKRPQFDSSPFQLVDKTSLTKMHFMFSMLGIAHAWCTSSGKLVGVISKKEFMKKCWELNQRG